MCLKSSTVLFVYGTSRLPLVLGILWDEAWKEPIKGAAAVLSDEKKGYGSQAKRLNILRITEPTLIGVHRDIIRRSLNSDAHKSSE